MVSRQSESSSSSAPTLIKGVLKESSPIPKTPVARTGSGPTTANKKKSSNNKLPVYSSPSPPKATSTPISTPSVKGGLKSKVGKDASHYCDKGVQTDHPDLALITGEDDAPLEYWKRLAESRREALEETLSENEALHQRIADLEEENRTMDEMVQQAKSMAELISSLAAEDDSGIATGGDDTNNESGLEEEQE